MTTATPPKPPALPPTPPGRAAAETAAPTIDDGSLTIATVKPAFDPMGDRRRSRDPAGFEAAVARRRWRDGLPGRRRRADPHHLRRGDSARREELLHEPPGASITRSAARTSTSRCLIFTSNQAIVALEGSAAQGATSIADLKDVKFGAQVGTTSLAFITDVIQPSQDPFVYDDNVGAEQVAPSRPTRSTPRCSTCRPRWTRRRRDRGQRRDRAVPGHGGTDPPVRLRAREGQRARRRASDAAITAC